MMAAVIGAGAAVAVALTIRPAPTVRRPGPSSTRPTIRSHSDAVARADAAIDRTWTTRRHRRRDALLPDALDHLAAALRGGAAVGPALSDVAVGAPDPLGAELRRVTRPLEHGAPLTDVLARWAASDDSTPDVRLVAAALTLGADAGGQVARAVDRVVATLRERRELRVEVQALATQARASAAVLAVAPLLFAALVATIDSSTIRFLVATPIGLACLAGGLGLEALGVIWMTRIVGGAG
jgi:tight adherence protein B